MSKSWHLSRRTMLRGLGIALALPMLEAMTPRGRRAHAADPTAQRFLFNFSFPMGFGVNGNSEPFLEVMQHFSELAGYYTLLTGVNAIVHSNHNDRNDAADKWNIPNAPSNANGAHGSAAVGFYSGEVAPGLISQGKWQVAQSYNQRIARHLAQQHAHLRPSVSVNLLPSASQPEPNYAGYHFENLWYDDPTTPVVSRANPKDLFDDLFTGFTGGQTDPGAADAARAKGKSVIDAVRDDEQSLRVRLGKADTARLDEYLASVRTLEQRIAQTTGASCGAPTEPTSMPVGLDNYVARADLMEDLFVAAAECDMTRVLNLRFGSDDCPLGFLPGGIGQFESWHSAQHWDDGIYKVNGTSTRKRDGLLGAVKFVHERTARFAKRLRDTALPDGTNLLDKSLIVLSTPMHNKNHETQMVQVSLLGKANGAFRPRDHLAEPRTFMSRQYGTSFRPVTDLWLTICRAYGVDVDTLGSHDGRSTGVIDGLLA